MMIFRFSPKSLRVFSVASFSTVATSLADEFRQAQVEDQIQALKEELHQRKAGPGPPWPPWPEGLTSETSGNWLELIVTSLSKVFLLEVFAPISLFCNLNQASKGLTNTKEKQQKQPKGFELSSVWKGAEQCAQEDWRNSSRSSRREACSPWTCWSIHH